MLNGTGSVSPSTAARVRACVEDLQYRANRVAVAHRRGQSTMFGLAVPDLTNPFFPEFAQGAHRVAAEHGFSVLLIDNASAGAAESIGRLTDYVPAGLIWAPPADGAGTDELPDTGFPVVGFDIHTDRFDTVSADLEAGGQLQAEMIMSHGHRRVGIIAGPETSRPARRRRDGLVDALGQAGVDIAWQVASPFSSNLSDRATSRVLDRRRKVGCIATANDIQAIAVLAALHAGGRRVPDDVSVVGFDGIDLSAMVSPSLSTVALDPRRLGAMAAELLIDRIADPAGPRRDLRLPVTPQYRESLA